MDMNQNTFGINLGVGIHDVTCDSDISVGVHDVICTRNFYIELYMIQYAPEMFDIDLSIGVCI